MPDSDQHQTIDGAADGAESTASDATSRATDRQMEGAYCPRCETRRAIALFGTTCLACGEELATPSRD